MKNIFNFLLILFISVSALFAQKPYVEYWHNGQKATEGTLSDKGVISWMMLFDGALFIR